MKYSRLFGKTVREAKRDMTAVSHKLLYQAGFTRELSAGRYEMLPLGMRVEQKLIALIDKEMERIGSQRVSIPILQPMEFWKKSNRDKAWGSSLMRIKDARDAEFALSATGEGVITEMVAGENPTYKDLPIVVHQFIIKLRDELRPKGGLLRTREFIMKDAYSFNESEEDFMKTYNSFYEAYSNICNEIGLTDFYPVIADSGALGGDYCHEFQVPCEAGEDFIVKCNKCDYAANTELAVFEREEINKNEEEKEFKMVDLPYEVQKIKDLVDHYNMPEERFIKNVVYKTSDGQLVIATVTGNLDVNAFKLAKLVGKGELSEASEEDLVSIGAKTGFVHSWGYEEHKDNIIFAADIGLKTARNLYGGYKTDTQDPINVNYGRDFTSDLEGDIAEVPDGAVCMKCKGELSRIKTTEFGHIFKYDHFYTEHHDGFFVSKEGEKKLMYMGAYGIGIGRAIALVVEKHHDENGIIWPESVAPYKYHLVSLDYEKDPAVKELTDKVYEKLNGDILWDDRTDLSAGAKFADADLIGCPIRLVVSKRSLDAGGIEMKRRDEKESKVVKIEEI
ncbi:proline--tRNA ligase [Candidatus Dojkabacteria bacterium]|uniref:Proline--tRNA ligase n=1 Tax=Candidatus Dojkabacteria bacterium TaxID=2099670 RepID=A0A955L3W5_9BACT|nr:proline--tRNA ligase [Candidatus Dojkabacteria bacterium]